MAYRIVLPPDEKALEAAADALLASVPPDPDRPAYTERQLARRFPVTVSVDALAGVVAPPSQPMLDEMRFLASVSPMEPDARRCLGLWLAGWSQLEIGEGCAMPQQRVSLFVRSALRTCYDAAPLSFRLFSHHTIYRRPLHAEPSARPRCPRCGASTDPGRHTRSQMCDACRKHRSDNDTKVPEGA